MQFINTVHWITLQPVLQKSIRQPILKVRRFSPDITNLDVSDSSEAQGWFHPGTVLNQPFKDIIKITLLYQYCIVRKLYGKDKI